MQSWLTPLPLEGEIVVLQSPPGELMLALVAALALNGPVVVVDANNQFDAYRLARLIRRRTVELHQVLERVQVSRAFTCYQVAALFEELLPRPMPHVVFDLPATFYDESVRPDESRRLLRVVLEHARRVSRIAPVIISARQPRGAERRELIAAVMAAADRLLTWEEPDVAGQARLFS